MSSEQSTTAQPICEHASKSSSSDDAADGVPPPSAAEPAQPTTDSRCADAGHDDAGDKLGGELRKKRAADNNDHGETSKAVSPKKTRLFGSLGKDGSSGTKGNFFSSALNKLASQNIDIKPLASKVDFVDETNEDSRMSWTAETPKVFGDASRKTAVKEVIVETGEEEEETILEIHGKLYMFSSECGMWKERGRGVLKLNDRRIDTSSANAIPQSRLVMRSTGTLRLLLNSNLYAKMDVTRTSTSSVRFSAQQAGALRIFSIKASATDCDRLVNELQYRVERLTSVASQGEYRQDSEGSEDRQGSEERHVASRRNDVSKTNHVEKSDPKFWFEVSFTKNCRLVGDEQSTEDSLLVLTLEKAVEGSTEDDPLFTELITLRNIEERKEPDKLIFRCSPSDIVCKRVDDLSVSMEFLDQRTYTLKFDSSCDATEVFSIWPRDVDQRRSSQSSSSSYESAQSGTSTADSNKDGSTTTDT